MDMILRDLEAQYDLLTTTLEQTKEELEKIDVTSFTLQPEITRLTEEIADINRRREVINFQITNYKATIEAKEKENGGQ